MQLGEAAYLAEELRVPVVSNFRAADIAAGGQGAPLATLFHQITFGQPGSLVCVNNLGGISNLTSIDWRAARKPNLLAFDTGEPFFNRVWCRLSKLSPLDALATLTEFTARSLTLNYRLHGVLSLAA